MLLGIYVDDGVIAACYSGDIVISQRAYSGRIIERFNIGESLPVSIPIDYNRTNVFSVNSSGTNFPYRAAVGSLNYLAVATRPDIAFAVGVASRHMANPGPADVKLVKKIIRYVKGTKDQGLTYKSGTVMELISYSDSDYAGCEATRRSTSGALFMLAGGAVGWSSKRQRTVALSTCEAEYVAAACAAKELLWMKRLLKEMIGIFKTQILYIDNQSAIKLINNKMTNDRSKHIDVKYHFIRELVENGQIIPEFVGTRDQLADIFTKPLNSDLIAKFKNEIGLK